MNSFIQALYMAYEFRSAILSMPLCKTSIDEPSDYVEKAKFKFLFQWQKLFIELQSIEESSASTHELTDTFGWNDAQGQDQHDF